jgi:hypothetical protein
MKEKAPLLQKIGHFPETKKTHHGIHRDRSTGSLTTTAANIFYLN